MAWGGLYDLGSYDRKPPLIKDGYRFLTGARDWDDTRRATAFISLRGVAERIACPFLVVQGARDNSVPVADAERMVAEAKGPSTLWVVPDSIPDPPSGT